MKNIVEHCLDVVLPFSNKIKIRCWNVVDLPWIDMVDHSTLNSLCDDEKVKALPISLIGFSYMTHRHRFSVCLSVCLIKNLNLLEKSQKC